MKNLKIAIIGAGICGLYLSWKLAKKGYNVTVFEKKEKVGKEACSGLFSERILGFVPESQNLIQNKIESAFIHFPKRTLQIRFSKRFLVMDHYELDNLVASLAESAGAKIILNYFVNSLPEGFDRIIGCDGADSAIRKNLRLKNPQFRLAIQGFIACPVPSERSEDWCGVETWPSKSGFIWRIPRAPHQKFDGREIEYGIIDEPKEVKEIFNNFLKRNDLKLERLKSGIVPQGFLIPSHPKVTLCGDASGLTKPWSGGGVVWGLTAADILLKNFPDFLKYQKEMEKFFLPKIILSKIVTSMAYFLGFKTPWILPKKLKIESDFLL